MFQINGNSESFPQTSIPSIVSSLLGRRHILVAALPYFGPRMSDDEPKEENNDC